MTTTPATVPEARVDTDMGFCPKCGNDTEEGDGGWYRLQYVNPKIMPEVFSDETEFIMGTCHECNYTWARQVLFEDDNGMPKRESDDGVFDVKTYHEALSLIDFLDSLTDEELELG